MQNIIPLQSVKCDNLFLYFCLLTIIKTRIRSFRRFHHSHTVNMVKMESPSRP